MSKVVEFIKQSRGLSILVWSMIISFATMAAVVILAAPLAQYSPALTLIGFVLSFMILAGAGVSWWVGLILFFIEQSQQEDAADGIPTS